MFAQNWIGQSAQQLLYFTTGTLFLPHVILTLFVRGRLLFFLAADASRFVLRCRGGARDLAHTMGTGVDYVNASYVDVI